MVHAPKKRNQIFSAYRYFILLAHFNVSPWFALEFTLTATKYLRLTNIYMNLFFSVRIIQCTMMTGTFTWSLPFSSEISVICCPKYFSLLYPLQRPAFSENEAKAKHRNFTGIKFVEFTNNSSKLR